MKGIRYLIRITTPLLVPIFTASAQIMIAFLSHLYPRYLFLPATLFVPFFAQAQNVTFERIETPTIPVIAFAQDDQGFLWMGGDGLHRFDGYQFTSYYHNPGDTTSLSNNQVTSLLVDSKGNLWVGTEGSEGNLHRFDPKTGSFVRYSLISKVEQGSNEAYQLYEDRDGYLWIGTGHGKLHRFDPNTGEVITYDVPGGNRGIVVIIYEDSNGEFWISTGGETLAEDGGFYRFNRAIGSFDKIRFSLEESGSSLDVRVSSLHEDRDGQLWLGAWPLGLIRYNPVDGQFKTYENSYIEANSPADILEDGRGNLWLAYRMRGGLIKFDRQTGAFTRYSNEKERVLEGARNNAIKLFEDRQGMLWVSYTGDERAPSGVFKVVQAPGAFVHFDHDPDNGSSVSKHEYVYGIYEGSGSEIWFGLFRGGLNRFDPATGKFDRFSFIPGNPNALAPGSITNMLEDSHGTFWLGSFFPGLHHFEPREEIFTHSQDHLSILNGMITIGVLMVHEDRFGELWFGTWRDGLIRFDPESGDTTRYTYMPENPNSLIGNIVPYVGEDRDGNLWVGAYNENVAFRRGALHHFDRDTESFERFEEFGPSAVYKDMAGRSWVYSGTRGLIQWNRDTDFRKHYSMQEGFPSNSISCMFEDRSGILWISTKAGLVRLDPATDAINHFALEGDFREAPLSLAPGSCLLSSDGIAYLGREPGITSFRPDDFVFNAIPPDVAITEIQVEGEAINPHNLDQVSLASAEESKAIELDHQQDAFAIGYVGLHYEDPSRNTYRYRLEPYNDDWIEAGTERTARFFQVPPGNYIFRVQAANPNGNWNEEGASMAITILPPWWQTAWAYALYGALVIGGLVAADRIQRWRLIRREREKARIEIARLEAEAASERAEMAERLEEVKSRFFINLSHELRTPLILILGPLRDALAEVYGHVEDGLKHQLRTMQRNADRLLKLINELLDIEKLEAGGLQLHAQESDLVAFARALTLSFTSRAERDRKTLRFDTEVSELPVYFDRAKLEKVLYNLLSNAFKCTAAGDSVRVLVDVQDGAARIQVEDTGFGIPEADLARIFERFYQVNDASTRRHEGSGIGLSLAKELVILHGGTIEAASREGVGSTFMVMLPLGRMHLRDQDLVLKDEAVALDPDTDLESNAISAAVPDSSAAADEPVEGVRILIVEDNSDVRDYLKTHLNGYAVLEARDGQEGQDKALQYLPDLIISDVMMPVMDGIALCEALRKDVKTQDIPVILLTAKAAEAYKIEGLKVGADDYLYKPFSAKELLARTANLIDQRRRLQSKYREEVLLKPADVTISSADAAFVEKVKAIVEEQLSDSWFGVERLAEEVNLSRRQLQRRMNTIMQTTASTFIRDMRLERAVQLLEKKTGTVSEICYAVGYNDPQHFSMLFKQKYGYSPSDGKASA